MPPLRLRILDDVSANPDIPTADVVKCLQLPRKMINRILQELHLLELLTLDSIKYDEERERWIYRLAEDVDCATLQRLARNISTRLGTRARSNP
jgi:predicted transcriptional regulator